MRVTRIQVMTFIAAIAGLSGFGLAFVGMIVGSLVGRAMGKENGG